MNPSHTTNGADHSADNGADHVRANGAAVLGGARGVAPPVGAWLPRPAPATAADESLDVAAIARTLAHGWRHLLAWSVGGALVGLLLVAVVRPWYRASASVLVRNANDPTGSLLSRFGLAGDVAGAAAGGALGGVLKSSLETEVQLLQSRELAGMLVDSMALQARVLEPRGVPAIRLFAPGPIGGSFRRVKVAFTRAADGRYRAALGDTAVWLTPERPAALPGVGAVTLRAGALPPAFRVQFEDREDAITRATDRFAVEKLGGDVVELRFSGPDSLTAAAVPNAAIRTYLGLRRTVDRGLNARRYEFMAAQADSAARLLAQAEDALRREQERSGVVDPELSGKSALEALQEVRTQYLTLETERRASRALVAAVERGSLSPRELTAFPTFLRSPGINGVLGQINALEVERTRLLGTRTERDPDVAVLSRSIADLERGLLPLARTYTASLDRQVSALEEEQRAVEGQLGALPSQAERALRGQRDVKRLSQVVLGLQAQMIDAKLAAIGEGGQVRQVDVAVPPKRPLFPRPVWTLPGGALLGLLAGVAAVLGRGMWSSRVRSVADAERAARLPAARLHPGRPLWLGAAMEGVVVVVGVGTRAGSAGVGAAAEALAARARAAGCRVAIVGATGVTGAPPAEPAAARSADAASRVRAQAAEHDLVVVTAPSLDDPQVPAVLDRGSAVALVATEGVTRRTELAEAVDVLARLEVPTLGVALVRAGPARAGVAP